MMPRNPAARPRIGVDFHSFDGIYQGSRSHLTGLFAEAIGLAPHFDFVLFLARPDALRESHPAFSLPNVQRVAMPHWPGLARLALQLPWLRQRHRIDLLHTQYRIPPLALGPCACTIHDILFESYPDYFGKPFALQSKLTIRHAARKSALLFTVSEFSKSEIARRYGVADEKIVVVYNGVDRRRFFPGDEGRDAVVRLGLTPGNYLLTVGRLEPRKNHAGLFRAYAALTDAPPLVVVGQRDFGYRGLTELVESLGIAGKVRFLESVSDAELPAVIRHAGLLAYPSVAEGFGMPVIEAMASGVPVVTSETTALKEVAGNAAGLVQPGDPASIAGAMERILTNDVWRQELIKRGLERAAGFDWAVAAGRMLDAYDRHFAASPPIARNGRKDPA
jgi:glycosyltransferase involved in cell wall biosynthesis